MSLARLALRLAAIESLAPSANAASGPWPTAAGPRIYDSRIDPVEAAVTEAAYEAAIASLENKPIVTIYTEDDHSLPYGSEKAWPDEMTVTLVAEIMIASRGEIDIRAPDGSVQTVGTLEASVTDRQREMLLDLIDAQIRRVFDLRNQLAPLMMHVAMELRQIHDDPQRDAHRSVKIAARTVKFHFKVKKEVWPVYASDAPPEGIAALPIPLSKVAAALPEGSAALAVCVSVASALSAPPDLPAALEGVRIFATCDRPNSGATAAPSKTDLAAATFAAPGTVPFDIEASQGSVT